MRRERRSDWWSGRENKRFQRLMRRIYAGQRCDPGAASRDVSDGHVAFFIGENLTMFAANLGLAASSAHLLQTLQTPSSYRDFLYRSVTMVTCCFSEKTLQYALLVPVRKLSSGRCARYIKGHQSGAMHHRRNGRRCASRKGAKISQTRVLMLKGGRRGGNVYVLPGNEGEASA